MCSMKEVINTLNILNKNGLKRNKITGELQRVQHVQPCIFRSAV